MQRTVSYPADLLAERQLTVSAKVLWAFLHPPLRSDPYYFSIRGAAARLGMSRHTVRNGLSNLAAAGWARPGARGTDGRRPWRPLENEDAGGGSSVGKGSLGKTSFSRAEGPVPEDSARNAFSPPERTPEETPPETDTPAGRSRDGSASSTTTRAVDVPVDVFEADALPNKAKVVYACLQRAAQYQSGAAYARRGEIRFKEMSDLAGVCRNTAKAGFRMLYHHRWIDYRQKNRLHPLRFVLRNPERERRQKEVGAARYRIKRAKHKGEALMCEYLSLLIDSKDYSDNIRFGFMKNPLTDEPLEFDRCYSSKVAFEFNGPQHYGPTERYPSVEEAKKQRVRDLLKRSLCIEHGIELVVVHPEDLGFERMREKVEGLLPLRELESNELLSSFLDIASADYRQKAAQWELVAPEERSPGQLRG